MDENGRRTRLRDELSVPGFVIGIIGCVILTATSAYTALKMGALPWPTIFTSVTSLLLLRAFGRRDIAEANVTQIVMSAGSMVAGGLAFTIPGVWMLGLPGKVSWWEMLFVALAVDVGNTTTVVGVFEVASAPSADPSLRWELTTPRNLTSDEAFLLLNQLFGNWRASGAILSCVVPTHVAAWQAALTRAGNARPFVVGPGLRTGLKMHYRDPAEIGPDRIADAVAIRERYQMPAVVIDFGTTMNIEVIDEQGAFVGGLIAPGLALGARALSKRTARLPVVEIEMPKEVIGRSTREAMLSGIVFGEVARIDGLLDRVFAEIASEATVVLTGDYAHEISGLISHEAAVDDTLTLRGLHQLYLLNAAGSKRGS